MATKLQAKDETETSAPEAEAGPLLDLNDQAVRRMIKAAKKRGYVTNDELNDVLPSDQNTADQIEDIMSMLNEMGINVVDSEEAEEKTEREEGAADDDEPEGGELVESSPRASAVAVTQKAEPTDRTDDPVRM